VPAALAAVWRDRLRIFGRKRDKPSGGEFPQRDVWINLGVGLLLTLVLGAALYAPFWTGLEGILPRNRGNLFTASIPKVILDALVHSGIMDEASAQYYVRNIAYGLVAIIAGSLAIYVFQSRNATTSAEREKLVGRTLMAFYARLSYVNRTLLFCIGGVANYFVWDYVWLWNRTDMRTIQITSALAIYTLPLLYTLYTWLRPWFYRLRVAG
jgi:hypothetical protein